MWFLPRLCQFRTSAGVQNHEQTLFVLHVTGNHFVFSHIEILGRSGTLLWNTGDSFTNILLVLVNDKNSTKM